MSAKTLKLSEYLIHFCKILIGLLLLLLPASRVHVIKCANCIMEERFISCCNIKTLSKSRDTEDRNTLIYEHILNKIKQFSTELKDSTFDYVLCLWYPMYNSAARQ